jgi:Zn-dependent metalloprotease
MPTPSSRQTAQARLRNHATRSLGVAVVVTYLVLAPAAAKGRELVTVRNSTHHRITFEVQRSPMTGVATFVTPVGPTAATLPDNRTDALEFLVEYGSLFGIREPKRDLTLTRRWTDDLAHTHTRFQQMHAGIPVFSGIVHVHQRIDGSLVAANGRFYPIKEPVNPNPTLRTEDAVARASSELQPANPTLERIELVLVDPGWYGDPPAGVHLAHELVLADLPAGIREALLIDAHNGEVLDRWNLFHTALDRRIHYDDGSGQLPGILGRVEGQPPVPKLVEVNAAYDYFGDTYGFFDRAFGRDSLDDAGMPMVGTVNSRAIRCPNAFWSDDLGLAAFCKLTVSDDIVAHELTHGLTDFTANLVYQNQPGQLNESFSDVFGELVDLYNGGAERSGPPEETTWPGHPTGPGVDVPNDRRTACSSRQDGYQDGVRWLVGEDARAFATAIRDMWDPTCKRHPDRANSPFQTCDPSDNGGVHTGSGVPNHAFAILTDGKTFNGYTVRGIGPLKSGAVWHRALTTYLTRASDFLDAYDALNQAAADLVGAYPTDPRTGLPSDDAFTADDAAQVDFALRATEMHTPGFCGQVIPVLDSDPPPACPTRTILYRNDFDGDVHDWLVDNTAPPTAYDWTLTTEPLPFGRPGRAWFCDDPNIGDCDGIPTEDGVHSLYSPWIELPPTTRFPFASWTHYIASEVGWDGGNVRIRVNGGPWQLITSDAFTFNPYNSRIYGHYFEYNNPLAGQEGWTGLGGQWGTSQVDLTRYAGPGDWVQLRFDFGKDRCFGLVGWFVDDFEVFSCNDCDRDGLSDLAEFRYTRASLPLWPFGAGAPQSITLDDPPPARGDARLTFAAIADIQAPEEYVDVELNGAFLGRVFELRGQDCSITPRVDELVIPAGLFNATTAGRDSILTLTASGLVDPTICGGRTFIKVFIEYDVAAADADGNGLLDVCENCAVPPAPPADPTYSAAGRYLSLIPGTPGRRTALRVVAVEAPGSSAPLVNAARWVGEPIPLPPGSGFGDVAGGAQLGCEPVFVDWSVVDVLHLFGPAVVPGVTYHVQEVDLACIDAPGLDASFSQPRIVATARWGDVWGGAPGVPPDGRVDMHDVAAVLDAYKHITTAPPATRADLAPAVPDHLVSFLDIGQAVRAFKNMPYPFTDLPPCD